jgi:hypothetical protein
MEQLNMASESERDNGGTAEFLARGGDDIQRLVVVLALGMCRAVSSGTLSAAYACHRLFGPAVIARAREAGATPELLEALNLASELDAIERLVPDFFRASLDDLDSRLMKVLRTLTPGALEGEKWLVMPAREGG